MASPIETVELRGRHVRLEPLSQAHGPALARAGAGDRSTFSLTWVPAAEENAARRYSEVALAQHRAGMGLPFATVSTANDQVVGSTRFLNIEHWSWPEGQAHLDSDGPDAVEIGSTWLSAAAQRSAINTEAKLLMLGHAFDTWHSLRVCLKTDARNIRSRAAIERIGARFEGVLRNHMPAYDGGIRDSAFYAITNVEWPDVRAALEARLAGRH